LSLGLAEAASATGYGAPVTPANDGQVSTALATAPVISPRGTLIVLVTTAILLLGAGLLGTLLGPSARLRFLAGWR
jgi:hypothetical protein